MRVVCIVYVPSEMDASFFFFVPVNRTLRKREHYFNAGYLILHTHIPAHASHARLSAATRRVISALFGTG